MQLDPQLKILLVEDSGAMRKMEKTRAKEFGAG